MKIVFMGTPAMSVPVLDTLLSSSHEVAAVVTQPDRASGRGKQVTFSPVKQCALDHDIPVLQPETIAQENVLDHLEKIGADIFAVVAYAQKLPDRLLEMAPFGCINMHPSLLPKYRGSAPFRGPILNGDALSGVTIMKLVQKWDAGDILMQKTFPVDPKDTALTLEEKAVPLGAQMMLEVIDALQAGTLVPVPQDESQATYLKQIRKEEGIIRFEDSAEQIERQIRACVPWPSAYTWLEGKLFKIWDADVIRTPDRKKDPSFTCKYKDLCHSHEDGKARPYVPGSVMYVSGDMLLVKCGKDCLKLNEVQIEGKRRMKIDEFLRGKKIEAGTVFGNTDRDSK